MKSAKRLISVKKFLTIGIAVSEANFLLDVPTFALHLLSDRWQLDWKTKKFPSLSSGPDK